MAVNIRSIKIAVISVLVLAISIGGVIFAGYLVKLDREIRDRFAGARWALPAQVYAAPQELSAGLPLNSGDLVHELQRLGYRYDARLEMTGTCSARSARAEANSRGSHFWVVAVGRG